MPVQDHRQRQQTAGLLGIARPCRRRPQRRAAQVISRDRNRCHATHPKPNTERMDPHPEPLGNPKESTSTAVGIRRLQTAAPWLVLLEFCALIWWVTPWRVAATQFFDGRQNDGRPPGVWMVAMSAAVTWVFAKSIANASDLAYGYGLTGGLGYPVYYLSFVVAGAAIYLLRTRGGYRSLRCWCMDGSVGLRSAMRLLSSHAVQAQRRPPPSHSADPLPRHELAGVLSLALVRVGVDGPAASCAKVWLSTSEPGGPST